MNATELFLKDGRTAGVFYCEKCRVVARTKDDADQCCVPYICKTCGKETGRRFYTICDTCVTAKHAKEERERFDKAEKLTEWSGWVVCGDDFYESVSDMLDMVDHEELPQYVWACKSRQFVKVDICSILEGIGEDGYEDFDPDTLDGIPALDTALKAFEDANATVLSYEPDYTKAVLINP